MAMIQPTLQAVGNWSDKVAVPITTAMDASVQMFGSSGRDACLRAIIYMAKSAKAMTPQAKKNRKVHRDEHGRYVELVRAGKTSKVYDWMTGPNKPYKTWDAAKRIWRRGLAKRSWMWGLKGLTKNTGKPIHGVGTLRELITESESGFVLTNRLRYITAIMPSGFEQVAALKASNRIMAQVAKKVEREFSVQVPRLAAQRRRRTVRRLTKAWRDAQ